MYYAEACNEFAGPISASLRPGIEELSQRWRAVGNTVSDLTGSSFEPQTSTDERVTARPNNWSKISLKKRLHSTDEIWSGNVNIVGHGNHHSCPEAYIAW